MYRISIDKNSTDYSEKYCPSSIDEIVGHSKQKRHFHKWIMDYDKNRKTVFKLRELEDKKRKKTEKARLDNSSCVFINGDNGCGKTAFAKGILTGCGYELYALSTTTVKACNAEQYVSTLLSSGGINAILNDNINRKIALIIDEVESVSSKNENAVITEILKQNNVNWYFPIVFIADKKHNKLMTTLKTSCYHISLFKPHDDDMYDVLVNIYEKEDLRMNSEKVADNIIKHCSHDYRRLIITLQLLKEYFDKIVITTKSLQEFLEFSGKRDTHGTIYENTAKLFSEDLTIDESLRIYTEDKNNMPLMVQQNCYNVLNKYSNADKTEKLEIADKISKSILHADLIENCVFANQSWMLRDYNGLMGCSYPSYHMVQNIDGKKYYEDCESTKFGKWKVYNDYPKDLNKTSTLMINSKTIKITDQYFPDMTAHDYNYAKQLIHDLLDNDKIDDCKIMLDRYNISDAQLVNIFKIDKTMKTNVEIPKNIKSKFKHVTKKRK
jgi:hypothetical protein